jgi:DNA-binding response OmpR family regulator
MSEEKSVLCYPVLIFDPDPSVAAFCSSVLEGMGVRHKRATRLLEATEAAIRKTFSCAILPTEGDGAVVGRILRERMPSLPLLFLASSPQVLKQSALASLPDSRMIGKPLDRGELERAVWTILGSDENDWDGGHTLRLPPKGG